MKPAKAMKLKAPKAKESKAKAPTKVTHSRATKAPTAAVPVSLKRSKPNHPKWAEMIEAAVHALGYKQKGHSLAAIKKRIFEDNEIANPGAVKPFMRRGMTSAIQAGIIVQVKGVGLSGSFKLVPTKSRAKKDEDEDDDDEDGE